MMAAKIIPKVSKLSPRIIRILGCNPGKMTLQGTNCYLIGTGTKRLLLDTGDAKIPEFVKNLKSVLADEGAEIDDIVVTHWHHDHVGGVQDILATGCKANVWKFPRSDVANDLQTDYNGLAIKALVDRQLFKVDGASLEVVHTPGHTTDHVVAILREENAVFSGDCILGEGTAVFENLYDYMRSLVLIRDLSPTIIYPGHGNVVESPLAMIDHYIEHRNKREQQILEFLATRAGEAFEIMDIVRDLYKDVTQELWPAAAYNVSHHLEKLLRENKIERVEQDGVTSYKIHQSHKL